MVNPICKSRGLFHWFPADHLSHRQADAAAEMLPVRLASETVLLVHQQIELQRLKCVGFL
jgi:hypothetical protein